jgi:NAD(P)-dependent dehydrogenase (short-subunit alcohol dehydrogenase family)
LKPAEQARITTPFGFHSTAAEVIAGIDLSGKRMIVTGAASGIGIETARALAGAGAEVTLAVRDAETGAKVAAEIASSTGNRNLHVARLDLADRSSIAAFVAGWDGVSPYPRQQCGVMALLEQHTAEGWEMQFAINHLGHFALILANLPRLLVGDVTLKMHELI